jgi:tRNA modification GTPase
VRARPPGKEIIRSCSSNRPARWRRYPHRQCRSRCRGKLPKPRYADYLPFKDSDGSALDQGIALWFPGPNSFTGEDVLELQGHGGPVILDLLLKRILTLPGLRIAKPGEFSERAFLNDKLDLAQAEAIADLRPAAIA